MKPALKMTIRLEDIGLLNKIQDIRTFLELLEGQLEQGETLDEYDTAILDRMIAVYED